MAEIARRSFVKGAAAGALGVAAAGVLGSTSLAHADEPAAPAEGTEIPESSENIAIASYAIDEVIDTDVVVLGCGAAGLMAAMTIQEAGINTYLLEKGASCSVANGSQAGGPALAETSVQAELGETVSIETLYNCEYGFSRGTVNGALLRKCIANGQRVVSNFMDNGVNMGLMVDSYGMGFRARHNFISTEGLQVSGEDRFMPLMNKFEENGGVFEVNREGVSVNFNGDKVCGVIVRNTEDGSYIEYNCKAVLVATGGYAGNGLMLQQHFGDINIYPLCNTLSDGGGYNMVIEAGGIADRNWALCCNEFGGVNGKIGLSGFILAFASSTEKFAIYGGLIVDPNGDRFMNEQYLSDRPLALGGEMSMRVGKYYAVVDEAMYEACRDEGILEYYGNPADWYVGQTGLQGVTLSNLDADTENAIAQSWCCKGTLAECAEFFGMEHLEDSVNFYNEMCEAGQDSLFYKDSYLLKELSGDTYYVYEYEPSIWCTFGGVKTDDYCYALTPEQTPIPGLYVAGVDNGSIYSSPYYENEGAALGTSFTSGIVAGDCIVDYVNSL